MRFFYDWEFQETTKGLKPISVGMVREDGAELYLINGEYPIDEYLLPDPVNTWLRQNVLPYLPIRWTSGPYYSPDGTVVGDLDWDEDQPDYIDSVWNLESIRDRVEEFILGPGEDVELWTWYGAYDHVCLARLWGIMADLPAGMPMYSNDLRQLAHMIGVKPDSQHDDKHHPLADARWNMKTYCELAAVMRSFAVGVKQLAAGVRDGMTHAS